MNSYEEWYDLLNGEDIFNANPEDGVVSFDLGVSDSKLYCCIPWTGVLIWANDIRDKFIPIIGDIPGRYITINYCLNGRCEAGARDGDIDKCYIPEKYTRDTIFGELIDNPAGRSVLELYAKELLENEMFMKFAAASTVSDVISMLPPETESLIDMVLKACNDAEI